MPEPAGSNASVVFLALADFAQRPVAEQARLKARLEALVARAIEPLAAADRIVADTADGAALVILAPPAEALLLARRARRAAREGEEILPLRVGVNHGPVGVVTDPAGEVHLVGDGIGAGASITPFADPGQVVASRAFRDALEATDAERAGRLRLAGTITDPSLRAHEIYAFDPGSDGGGAAAAPGRRRAFLIAGASVAAILAAGFVVRGARRAAAQAKRPGFVELAITPWGEIRVDGENRGRSPPLTRLEVRPGRHTIEVKHPQHAPLTVQVDVSPGEEVTVRHAFATPRAAPAPAQAPAKSERKIPTPAEVWREFRRQSGL